MKIREPISSLVACCHGYRVQKQRASKSEDAVGHLNVQLMERDTTVAELHSENDGMRARCEKLGKEKAQASAEVSGLHM